jgi:Sugar (and other) transporter
MIMSPSGTRRQDFRGAHSLRTAVLALCLGNAVQWYDFALYGAFATIIGPVFFPAEDPSTAMLAAFATYGIALIMRPVGAVIFGRMADLRGRRAVFVPVPPHGRRHRGRRVSAGVRSHRHSGAHHIDHAPRRTGPGGRWGIGCDRRTHPGKCAQPPARPAGFLAHRHLGPRPRLRHGSRFGTASGPTVGSLGGWLVAAGFHPRVASGIGRQVCTPPSQRVEPVPCCFAGRANDQATHREALG